MIGVSLPLRWLAEGGKPYGERGAFLEALKAHGVHSAELRAVKADTDPSVVLAAAALLTSHGLAFTVHGTVRSAATAVRDVFAPLESLLAAKLQDKIVVTVHPIDGGNAAMLTALADHIEAAALPVVIALENNRLMPDKTEGDSAALAADALAAADRACLGSCFDMGHYHYYLSKHFPDSEGGLPKKGFLRRCVHTHIHAMEGGRTHFPLTSGELPLRRFLAALDDSYRGVYNLELDPARWPERDAAAELLASVDQLRASLLPCAQVRIDLHEHFDARFERAAAMPDAPGTTFALLQSTAYLFNTNGFRWAMDIAFRRAWELAKTPARAAELLRGFQLMLLSHSHADHFEEQTLRALAETEMRFVVPPFLREQTLALGIRPERLIVAVAGREISVGPLRILPFESRHFRPNGGAGVPEYGWRIDADGAPSMLFPVDVRDYAIETMPDVPPADICFGSVWLGDDNRGELSAMARAEAEFLLKLSDKTILLTHLYENARTSRQMWRREHAGQVAAAIRAASPSTQVCIPEAGEILHFN